MHKIAKKTSQKHTAPSFTSFIIHTDNTWLNCNIFTSTEDSTARYQ